MRNKIVVKVIYSFAMILGLLFHTVSHGLATGIPTFEYTTNLSIHDGIRGDLGDCCWTNETLKYLVVEIPAPSGKYFMQSIEDLKTSYSWEGSGNNSKSYLTFEGLTAEGKWVDLGRTNDANTNPIRSSSPFSLNEAVSSLRIYLNLYHREYSRYYIQSITIGVGSLGADQRTVNDARKAAQNAQNAANQANNTMNTIISPKLTMVEGAVRDSSGNTAISMARAAKSSADLASQNASFKTRILENRQKA